MRRLAGHRPSPVARALLALALAFALALPAAAPGDVVAQRPNGAGLVIRHGDGRVFTYYVEFTETEITGLELLMRSGAALALANFGGLGTAVCAIDGEGCPADNCFCQSYASPAYYWHYFRLEPGGTWVLQQVGPSNRQVRDGDVDGWSWTSGESGLPAISIDEIAAQHGVDRSASTEPTATPLAPSSPAPPAPTSTPPPVTPVLSPVAGTATPQPEGSPTALATHTPSPAAPMPGTPEVTATARATPVPAPSPANPSTALGADTPAAQPTPAAPSSSPQASSQVSNYFFFAAMLSALLGLAGWLAWRRSDDSSEGSGT
ncbi:hypothetical protein NET02_11830 [Thermomicrobiaceae bacterium CFH 74404]|uniref:Uncharacterized protein n=2 Tax=Thermomicrobia TaxID=189775 RepID=A0AA42BDK5_9BACT|nr:hypothetical protein [Thermalbibacter longus]MCM8749838.1 hypothetical protein [Thermalbibacter longus]